MKKAIDKIKQYKVYTIALGVIFLIVTMFFVFSGGNKKENFEVKRASVSQNVVLSGKVQTSDRADLGFAAAGRLANIFVKNNQEVKQGTILAQLEINDLLADLKIKQTELRKANLDVENAKEELEKIKKQEDAKVESAYRKLLSEDLELTKDDNSSITSPTISGLYNSEKEGSYKVIIDKERIGSEYNKLRTFGLETSSVNINKYSSTPLGTKGLYISFPSNDSSDYIDTVWYLDIPNKSGESYLANYNAYNEAKKNRDLAIHDAELKYERLLTEDDNGLSLIAQAEVDKISAEIRKNTIYAPFTGKVTNIEKEIGENVSVGERTISILGESKLEVVLKVSELDVARLIPGAEVILSFDSLPGEKFKGVLQTINSRDTEIDGVPVYEAFVDLENDLRIKTGMTATGEINIASKENVLVIPSYYTRKVNGKNVVDVVVDKKGNTEEREVVLGLVGTDSMVEVISGLNEGEKISGTPPTAK